MRPRDLYNPKISNLFFLFTDVDGAGHSEELSYMWTRIELTKDVDKAMTKTLMHLWTNFIKTLYVSPKSFHICSFSLLTHYYEVLRY